MSVFVPLALFGIIPFGMLAFVLLTARRAVIAVALIGTLFLPNAQYGIAGLPEYNKHSATLLAIVLGILIFDMARVVSFRMRWFDIPAFAIMAIAFCSALSNLRLPGSLYGGVSMAASVGLLYTLPWFIGRLYFSDRDGMRDLAIGLMIGGLIYIPLCLFEVRMSPQLHRMVYGFHPDRFVKTYRLGGFRPWVFMSDGLMLGIWMATTTIVAIWLTRSRAVVRFLGVPALWIAIALVITTVLCKAAGAIVLLAAVLGVQILLARTPLFKPAVLALVLIAPAYVMVRAAGLWHGEMVLPVLASVFGETRANSLSGRMENEDILVERAMERPLLGWSGWNRANVINERGKRVTTQDGLWVIVLGQSGLLGLATVLFMQLIAAYLMLRFLPPPVWWSKAAAPGVAVVFALTIYAIDNLLNAMPLPPLYIAMGAAAGFMGEYARQRKRIRHRVVAPRTIVRRSQASAAQRQ